MLKFLSSILIIVSTALHTNAQSFDAKDFIHYSLKEGLSDNYVSGIVQDPGGYMWIATRRGLNRFDGKTFRHFMRNDKYNAIPDNSIYSMRLLNDELLAIATDDGVQIISTKTLLHKNFSIADDDRLRYWSNACMSVLNDADGNLGISTKTGFYIFSPSGQLKKRYDKYTPADIGEWMLFGDDLYNLPDGNIFQLNADGALVYERDKNRLMNVANNYPFLKNLVHEKENNRFYSISDHDFLHLNKYTKTFDLVNIKKGKIASIPSCIDFKDIGWMTTISKINDTTWAVTCQTKGFFLITLDLERKRFSCSQKIYFADKLCTTIFMDRDNKLWVGTTEGLYKEDAHPKIIETIALESGSIEGQHITALYISKDKIFAGADQNKVFIIDKRSKKLIGSVQLPIVTNISNYVRDFHLYSNDTLWVGTSSGLSWLHMQNLSNGKIEYDKDEDIHSIYLLFSDNKKNMWIATYSINAVYYYDRQSRIFTRIDFLKYPKFRTNVASIAEDKDGNIWLAGDAIVRWNTKMQKIDTLIERLGTQQNSKRGYCVMSDSKGDIWTTVTDDGIAKLTGHKVHLRPNNLTRERGSFIGSTLINDKIFLFANKGAGYFDITGLKSIIFTYNDGMPAGPASTYFFARDAADGSAWLAIKNILCKIPAQPALNYLRPPVLNITALSVLNDTIFNYPADKITLNHRQADINLFYSAINYTDPENMQFAYRIKNENDSNWIETGTQNSILFTNFSPGRYVIQLKVSAYDNKWPDQFKEIEITVLPPFTKTAWFYAIVFLLMAAGVYFIYRYRINQINQKAKIDKQITELEIKGLHAQMNPHFIFNCLNSIREMILHNENQQASHYLSKFAQLIRITLNQSSKQFITLENTIDYLERYIEMEKIRNDNFSYEIEMDDQLQADEIMIPPMLIQPFIENAIWHGSVPDKELQIKIQFVKEGDRLLCQVTDNGPGIGATLIGKKDPNHHSIGIANVRERIQVLNEKYKWNSELCIEDQSINEGESGTVVKIYFPLHSNML